MGTPQAAVPSLRRLAADGHDIAAVYTQPDKPAGRGNKLTASPVKLAAQELGIQVLQPAGVRSEAALAEFVSLRADVAVVVAYGRILPQTFLDAFPYGAVNLHFSLLPRYRGAAPVNWAIANGETVTGVTTMKMDAGLDTGDVLLQREIAIAEDDTAASILELSAEIGAGLLSETIANLDDIVPIPQDDALATYAPILKKIDGLIDWGQPAAMIADRIRGFKPFPGTFTFLNGVRIGIVSGTAEKFGNGERAGEVLTADKSGIRVRCGGDSVLRISAAQPEGKRVLTAADIVNGSVLKVGDVLGE